MLREKDLTPIVQYIEKNVKNRTLESGLVENDDFETFKVFSAMRESLFNWYDFKENSSVLVMNDECGSIVGTICKTCKKVIVTAKSDVEKEIIEKRWVQYKEKLVVIKKNDVFFLNEKFNYIIFFEIEYLTKGGKNVIEYTNHLKEIVSMLSEEGVLLIPAENRYGIKYWCGEREPISQVPFAGINRFISKSGGYMLSREEIVSVVSGIEDLKYKIYYPFPDYYFPQMIFTDKYLPSDNLKERAISYSLSKDTLLIQEKMLYDDIARNNVFPFFSNAFLVECGRDEEKFSDVLYAVLSTDRGDVHGFSTTIHENDTVKKKALSKEGIEPLKNLVENSRHLSERGIKVVEHTYEERCITMPRMYLPALSDVLKEEIKRNPLRFKELFDGLYECILQSSEYSSELNQLFDGVEEMNNYDGVILKRAYIDMVPINCFFKDNDFLFFDQEFVFEDFPADYVIFRAIKYTYLAMPFANQIVPRESLIEHFKIKHIWSCFEKIENDFIYRNRRQDINSIFWKHNRLDGRTIKNNIDKLLENNKEV